MPHQVLDGKQIRSIFIQMCAKGMSERMACQAVLPSKFRFMLFQPTHDIQGTAGLCMISLRRKEPVGRFIKCKPVFSQDIQCILRQNGIAVRTVLGVSDMNTHIFTFNIRVLKGAYLPYAKTGRLHE